MMLSWHSAVSRLRESTYNDSIRAELDGRHDDAAKLRRMSGLCTTACSGDRPAIAEVEAELHRRGIQFEP